MERIETWKIIKGRIGETIAEEMLRELGFFVMKLGKEHTANPLDQLKNFVESCGGKFKLEKLGMEIREISHINVLPDFVIVSPKNGKVQLIEVKYRWDAELYDRDLMVFKTYPEAHMLVINTEVSEKIREISEKESANKEDLMKSRFHIWTNKQNLKDNNVKGNITGFDEWLKEDFDISLEKSFIEKYERLVNYWLREDRGKVEEEGGLGSSTKIGKKPKR